MDVAALCLENMAGSDLLPMPASIGLLTANALSQFSHIIVMVLIMMILVIVLFRTKFGPLTYCVYTFSSFTETIERKKKKRDTHRVGYLCVCMRRVIGNGVKSDTWSNVLAVGRW